MAPASNPSEGIDVDGLTEIAGGPTDSQPGMGGERLTTGHGNAEVIEGRAV
jgi:hypothetical protein